MNPLRPFAHHLTVLSVGDRWLKAVHATGRPPARKVDAVLIQSVVGMDDEQILGWFRQEWSSRGLEPGQVVVANPSHLTTVRPFTLPSTDPKEIRDIVELQAEKHTPYAKEEILCDVFLVETDPGGYSRILMVISHQDVVYRSLRLVQAMGWSLERVSLEMEGLPHWFSVTQGKPGASETVMVAELEGELTNVTVVQSGRPQYHRSLAIGARQVASEGTEGVAKLVEEFQRTLEGLEVEGLKLKISKVLLTGQAAQNPGLAVSLEQGLSLPASVVPALEGIPMTEPARQEGQAQTEVSLASLIGLTFGAGQVDLTPKALKLHRTFEVRSRALVGVGCQLIAGLLLASCVVMGKAYQNQRYHTWLVQEHTRISREVGAVASLMEQIRFVEQWRDASPQLLDAVTDLVAQTPGDVRWSAMSFVRGDQLSIKGTSPETPKVFDMVARWRESPRFSKVEARRTTRKKAEGADLTEFEVLCTFIEEGPEKEVEG